MKKFILAAFCGLACTSAYTQPAHYKELLLNGKNADLIQLILSETPQAQIAGDTARMLAQAYEGLLKYREAHTYYSRWLCADTLNTDALNATARMSLQLGRVQEGENLYLKAYAIDSTHFNTGLQLAKLNYQLKNYEKAYHYYYPLLLQDTTNVSLLVNVGDCLSRLGEEMDAMFFYEEAVSLNKENASLSIILINNILGLRQYNPEIFLERAMTVCDTALHYTPAHTGLLQSKGVIYYLSDNYHACDSVMSGLIAAGDSSLINFRYVSLSNYNRNMFFRAIPYIEYYYRHDTTNVEAAMMLGVSLGRTYDHKRALSLFNDVERMVHPAEEQLYNLAYQRGMVYQATQNPSEAAKYYLQAAEISKKQKRAALSSLIALYPFTKNRLAQADTEQYEKGLFAYVAYLRAVKEEPANNNQRNTEYAQFVLSLFLEDLSFKDADRLYMRAPDGKKEWVTREELERLCK